MRSGAVFGLALVVAATLLPALIWFFDKDRARD